MLTQIQHSIYNSLQLAVHAPDGAPELQSPLFFALSVQNAYGDILANVDHGGAFADDLILGSSLTDLNTALQEAPKYLEPLGLRLNTAKSKHKK